LTLSELIHTNKTSTFIIRVRILVKKNIHLHLFIQVKMSTAVLEKRLERLTLLTRINEGIFKKIILPKNKVSQETIQKIQDQIRRMKISLLSRPLNKEKIQIFEGHHNRLTQDLIDAAKISGIDYKVDVLRTAS